MHVGTNHLSFHYLTQVFDIISSSLLLLSSPKKEQQSENQTKFSCISGMIWQINCYIMKL